MGGGNVSQDQTSIICIDLKSFYASVECVERGLESRMSDPKMIKGIQEAVSIPVMAKCRIGHFAEAQIISR